MSIVDILIKMPCWYIWILIIFSLYYAIRGIMEHRFNLAHLEEKDKLKKLSTTEKVVIHYIQEFLFKVIFTTSSFMALFFANYIFSSLKSVNDVGMGTAILLIFLLVWGICGVSGYLTLLVVSGKFPFTK